MQTVWNFSDDDIYREFGLHTCARIVPKKRKWIHLQNLILDIVREIWKPEQRKTYKNVGTEECEGIQGQQMKKKKKIEEGMHHEIKDFTEPWVEC
jgi:hypothetical protein